MWTGVVIVSLTCVINIIFINNTQYLEMFVINNLFQICKLQKLKELFIVFKMYYSCILIFTYILILNIYSIHFT